ncbi:DUF2177 family protein [Pikeienuella piscinae]|uniref:DUF2177 family protein n=1 Tax=Pikeienuella piscinae TaxID=2748098 RepID=A0A7L5BT28_9RHOB|nr:DUF2177 family protein [Pikeienuella piscinae]QIE54352.1 DUF2177 family protein [Pikeienuella piscinae]
MSAAGLAFLYAATAAIFVCADLVGLNMIVKQVFMRDAAPLFLDEVRAIPALLFYLSYVAGLVWFVSAPALQRGDSLMGAFITAAGFGAVAYGAYEFTNLATLAAWTRAMACVDLLWGALLSGVSTVGALGLARRVLKTS